jgi:hypothetical protein
MCLGPEAYGHATATRIFSCELDIGCHDTRPLSRLRARERTSREHGGAEQRSKP